MPSPREIGLEVLRLDALLAASPRCQLLFLSHDARIEICRDFAGRRLAERLIALGYWRRAIRQGRTRV